MIGMNTSKANAAGKTEAAAQGSLLLRAVICVCLLSALAMTFFVVDVRLHASNLMAWIDENPTKGFFVFIAFYSIGTVLLLPGLILSLGAGAVFGLAWGLLAVGIGATIGETLAFLLGRFLFREYVAQITQRYEWWQAVEHAIEHEGWKIVLLLRLTPLVPFNLLNYALACTAVRFWDYSWASSVGVLPGMAVFIYLGSLAQNIASLASSSTAPKLDSTATVATGVLSGVMITVVALVTGTYAKRAIKMKLEREPTGETIELLEKRSEVPPLQRHAVHSARPSLPV